jgi:hypothetical protein
MKFSELVTLYFERFNAEQTLWGIYITIALGILAFFGTLRPSKKATTVALLFSVGFVAFAFVNAMALGYVVNVRAKIYCVVQHYHAHDSSEDQAVIEKVKPTVTELYSIWMLVIFHASCDLMVLAAIWRLAQHSQEKEPQTLDEQVAHP